ncbi:MAG: hypothetical protein J5622_05400 [Firmicutes bacterium]|nr:hypothetical protein [Bacillota bacterium]
MTTPYMTSSFRTRSRRRCLLNNQFTVEIQDFDGDQVIYEVCAESHHEAAREAHELAYADGIQINIMTIYEF